MMNINVYIIINIFDICMFKEYKHKNKSLSSILTFPTICPAMDSFIVLSSLYFFTRAVLSSHYACCQQLTAAIW